MTQQANANGTITTRGYDPDRGFLTGIHTTAPGATLQNLSYELDPKGLVEQVTSPFPEEGWDYTYDELSRMTSAANVSNPAQSQTFVYDAVGRITSNSRVGVYTYPSAGQPRPHGPLTAGTQSYGYDANGNLVSGANRALTWDDRNLLASATVGTVTTAFAYDGLDQRVKKSSGSNATLYPFGDDLEIMNGTVTKYLTVEGVGVVAKRVGSTPSITTYWLHTDRLRSVNTVSDALGAEVQRRSYRPFGETVVQSASHVESRGWVGQRNDTETGLTDLHARYYDPTIGAFVSPDPSHPGEPGVGSNRYAYGFGDPLNGSDVGGLYWVCVTVVDESKGDHMWCYWVSDHDRGDGRDPGGGNGGPGGNRPEPEPPTEPSGPFEKQKKEDDPPNCLMTCDPDPSDGKNGTAESDDGVTLSYDDVEVRLAAFWDGVVPFERFDPFSDLTTGCAECWFSEETGAWTRDAELVLGASASTALFGRGTWLNTGFSRIGHSTHRGSVNFSYRMGSRHWDFWRLWRR